MSTFKRGLSPGRKGPGPAEATPGPGSMFSPLQGAGSGRHAPLWAIVVLKEVVERASLRFGENLLNELGG